MNTSVETSITCPTEGKGSSGKPKKCNRRNFRKVCPIPGCQAKPQVKLSNHFDKFHRQITKEERRLLIKNAKKIPRFEKNRVVLRTSKGQPTLEQIIRAPTPVSSEEEEVAEDVGVGTRSFPRYSKSESTLVSFETYLQNIDGNQRSPKVAHEMATDVSKFLKFACGAAPLPDWERLLDRDIIIAYMDKLKRFKIEADGRISKLDALDAGLTFMRRNLCKDDPNNTIFQRAMRMSDTIKGWKCTLRKEKTKRRMKRMEDLSSSHLTLDEVDEMIQNESMWRSFNDIVDRMGKDLQVSTQEMDSCTIMVAALLTFRSWQRPGAVVNATMSEYRNSTEIVQEGETLTILKVADHKTGLFGSAKLVIPPDDLSKLHSYVTVVRPSQDPSQKSPYLLCLDGGKQITNFNARFKVLAKRFGISPITATGVRKRASTEAARHLSSQEATLVTRQLSHSTETDARFYQALSGPSHAAEAFVSLNKMRQVRKKVKPGCALDPPGKTLATPEHSLTPAHTPSSPSPTLEKEYPTISQSLTPARKRVPFSPEEEETVRLYFDDYLKFKKTPSLSECSTFLKNHPLQRNPKQIQDKIKNFNKK